MESYARTAAPSSHPLLDQLRLKAKDMALWLKIIGIAYIIVGVPTVIALVGILYIWLGLLLYKAGKAADSADGQDLLTMLDKLKTYFTVMAILTILGVIVMIIYIVVIIGLLSTGALNEIM